MKRICIIIAALMCAASLIYAKSGVSYADKARRAFDQQEWATASALYTLAIDQDPGCGDLYGYAIAAAAMKQDTISQLQFFDQSINNHVPFDSTFAAVKRVSFSLAHDSMYEQFMLMVQRNYSWLGRAVDAYLLNYYVYRHNAPAIITYSRKMLAGLPNDMRYLTILADALMQDSQTADALATYNHIIDLDPDNYNVHLTLGNYYALAADDDDSRSRAVAHLKKANALRPTPHATALINALECK